MEVAPDTMFVSLLAGEQWAYEAAVDEFGPAVIAIAATHRLGKADRDEVFQATFLSLLENRHRIHSPESLPAWIVRVATNHCLSAKRLRERPSAPIDLTDEIDLTVDVHGSNNEGTTQQRFDWATEDFSLDEQRAVIEAVASLNDRDRALLHLLFAEHHYRYDTIASMLEVSPHSVGPLRSRMLARLRNHPAVQTMIGQRRTA